MGWTIAIGAAWWILTWVVIKFTHMIVATTRRSWDLGAGIGIAIVQGVIDVMIVLGVVGFLIGVAVHFVGLLV